MYEVELKLRAEHDAVRDRLAATDAGHAGRIEQRDTYYRAPDRDFAATDEALRVRVESPGSDSDSEDGDERTLLTYKGPLVDGDSKSRREAETAVDDAEALAAILEGLGYEPTATVQKNRDRYRLAGCAVVLDRVEGLGEFVEVETEADRETDEALAAARERTIEVLERLDLDPDEQIRTSYLGQLLAARDGS